jgi:hypothetical protein
MRRVESIVAIAMLAISVGESAAQATKRPLREPESVSEATDRLRYGSEAERQLAKGALPRLFGDRSPLAASAVAIAVVARVVDETIRQRRDSGFYVLEDSIPVALRNRWANRFRFVHLADWQQMPELEGAKLLIVGAVEGMGSLARVRTQVVERMSRQPNESVRLYFGGATYYVLEMNEAWTVVAANVWET